MESRDYTVSVTMTVNQYRTLKYYSNTAPISNTMANCVIYRIEHPESSPFELHNPTEIGEKRKCKYGFRFTKSQYDMFMEYYNSRFGHSEESLAGCIRNLIFEKGGFRG